MTRRVVLVVSLVGAVSGEARAQSEADYTVIAGLSVEYAPANEHALGVRLYGTTPVLIQPRCPVSEGSCHGPWPSVAPELGVGWRSATGFHVDMGLGAGVTTARVYGRGWAPRVQVMPQVGLRVHFTSPLERWVGGYVSKTLAGGWSSRNPATPAEDSAWGLTAARVGVQVPYSGGEWGAVRLGAGAQATMRPVVAHGLTAGDVEK